MKLTAARLAGLKVLVSAEIAGRPVRRSNRTGTPSPTYPCVYWQTADWLVAEGLAVEDPPGFLTITAKGPLARRGAGVNRCRSCRAPITWVRTTNGKLMPLDAEPRPDGNVELVDGRAVVHAQPPLTAGELYMPHHASCPQAKEWSRR